MEKKKTFFGLSLQSISKTIIAAMTASSIVLTVIGFMLDHKMDPINNYISVQATRSIERQYYKITETPNDIKPMDLSFAVDDYSRLDKKYKKPSLDSKSDVIENYYLKIPGGIND